MWYLGTWTWTLWCLPVMAVHLPLTQEQKNRLMALLLGPLNSWFRSCFCPQCRTEDPVEVEEEEWRAVEIPKALHHMVPPSTAYPSTPRRPWLKRDFVFNTQCIYIYCAKKMQLFHVHWDRWHNKIIIHLYIYISLLYHKWQGCILTSDAETCAAVGDCSYQP